jgi:hypothetical protein
MTLNYPPIPLHDPWRDRTASRPWQSHELLWLAAAESLPFRERLMAYRDIGLMTGRTKRQIEDKTSRMRHPRRPVVVNAELTTTPSALTEMGGGVV